MSTEEFAAIYDSDVVSVVDVKVGDYINVFGGRTYWCVDRVFHLGDLDDGPTTMLLLSLETSDMPDKDHTQKIYSDEFSFLRFKKKQ